MVAVLMMWNALMTARLQTVALLRAMPSIGLARGQVGTVAETLTGLCWWNSATTRAALTPSCHARRPIFWCCTTSESRWSRTARPSVCRSAFGKILRGDLKKIADNEPWTMPATIEDPKVLDEIRDAVKGRLGA
jgi:hypothetical protein